MDITSFNDELQENHILLTGLRLVFSDFLELPALCNDYIHSVVDRC